MKYSLKNLNFKLIISVILLNLIGLFVVRSASNGSNVMLEKEIIGIGVGMVAMFILAIFPYDKLLSLKYIIYGVCIVLLALVLISGRAKGMARRWIEFPVIGKIQPSEFVKIGLILFFAKFLGDNEAKLNEAGCFFLTALLAAIPLLLIFLEPDLSTTIIIFMMIVSMIYVAGLNYKWIGGILAILIPLFIVFFLLLKNNLIPFINDYQVTRVMAWLDPSAYSDETLQQKNSIMAIASGGALGKGLNNNTLASVKNGNFLAEEETDFIFAVVGEELGFVGCIAVIVLISIIVIELFRMAHRAPDMEGKLVCTGLGALIGFQAFTNIAVATGIFPNTGLPLPFISYGVSSLFSLYIGLGVALNVGLTPQIDPLTRRFL